MASQNLRQKLAQFNQEQRENQNHNDNPPVHDQSRSNHDVSDVKNAPRGPKKPRGVIEGGI